MVANSESRLCRGAVVVAILLVCWKPLFDDGAASGRENVLPLLLVLLLMLLNALNGVFVESVCCAPNKPPPVEPCVAVVAVVVPSAGANKDGVGFDRVLLFGCDANEEPNIPRPAEEGEGEGGGAVPVPITGVAAGNCKFPKDGLGLGLTVGVPAGVGAAKVDEGCALFPPNPPLKESDGSEKEDVAFGVSVGVGDGDGVACG